MFDNENEYDRKVEEERQARSVDIVGEETPYHVQGRDRGAKVDKIGLHGGELEGPERERRVPMYVGVIMEINLFNLMI